MFKNCAPFIDCINEINNPQGDKAKSVGIPIYNFIEYRNNYLQTLDFMEVLAKCQMSQMPLY